MSPPLSHIRNYQFRSYKSDNLIVLFIYDTGEEIADASLFNKLVHNKLVEVTQTDMLDVLKKDPNSPLYSVKSFEELRL